MSFLPEYQELQECTVRIQTPEGKCLGTGFFITPNFVLTCLHVVEVEKHGNVRKNVVLIPFKKEGGLQLELAIDAIVEEVYNRPLDLALLRLPDHLPDPACAYLSSAELNGLDDRLAAWGYSDTKPEGDTFTGNSEGISIVSGIREIKMKDGQVKPGFSGSPLCQISNGHVVGINKKSRDKDTDLGGYATPADEIWKVLPLEVRKAHDAWHLARFENDLHVISDGFYKINRAFIEKERNRSGDSCTPERFYMADPNAQWWGVFNDLVAPHNYYPGFKKEVEYGIFNSPYPVLAMLEGSGGMGKSTLARLLAAEMAISRLSDVWWLEAEGYEKEQLREDWEEMLHTTGGSFTLVIVDDWGKFDESARKFMQGIFRKAPERIRFVLTGRYQEDDGLEQKHMPAECRLIFDNNAELTLDNQYLLDKVQAAVHQDLGWQSTLMVLGDVTQAKPFQLLYVLFRLVEDPALKQAIKSTRSTGIFRDILQYDLDRLQNSNKKGLGWALVFLAYSQTELKSNISKSSFLQLADHCSDPYSPLKWAVDLGNKPIKEWMTLRHYCVEMFSPRNKRADSPILINLSKDELAEELLNIRFEGFKTGRDFLIRHKKSLLTYLCEHGSTFSASTMCHAVNKYEQDLFSRQELRGFLDMQLEKKNSHHGYITSIFYQADWPFNEIWEMVKKFSAIAPSNSFFWAFVISWLRKKIPNNNKDILEKIREIKDWGGEGFPIDCELLNVLPNSEKQDVAKRLIWESKYHQVICNCLEILKNEQEGQDAAKQLIWASKSYEVICNCLEILKNEQEGQDAAKRLIWESKHHHVVSKCLEILKNEQGGKDAAKRLIWESKSFEVICNCLEVLKSEPEGKDAAKRLIWESKDKEVICNCLEILKSEPGGKDAAKRLIWESKDKEVICNCLEILKSEPGGKDAAKRLIWESKDKEVICNCLEILKSEPEGQEYAIEILKKWIVERVEIVLVALRIAPPENSQPIVESILAAPENEYKRLRFSILYRNYMGIPAWQQQTRDILKNWRGNNRIQVGGILPHYQSEEAFLLPICSSIIANSAKEMQSAKKLARKGKPPYVGHMITAFAHPALRKEAKMKAIELLLEETKLPGFLSPYFKEKMEGIVWRDEFEVWGELSESEE